MSAWCRILEENDTCLSIPASFVCGQKGICTLESTVNNFQHNQLMQVKNCEAEEMQSARSQLGIKDIHF